MARIEYADITSPGISELAGVIQRARGGQLLNLFKMMLHAPEVTEAWLGLGGAVRYATTLDGRSRELAICLVARLTACDYEWAHHAPLALREGIDPAALDALPGWEAAPGLTARDRAVLAYAGMLTVEVDVDDETFARVQRELGDRGLVELTATVALYGCTARFVKALRIDLDEEPGTPFGR